MNEGAGRKVNRMDPSDRFKAMTYYNENRLKVHRYWDTGPLIPQVTTYLYEGGGPKRVENVDDKVTTIVWDGDDYLGEVQ